MQKQLSGAIIRMHGPLNLALWDRIVRTIATAFLILGVVLYATHSTPPATVSIGGGLLLLAQCRHERRKHDLAVWTMAAAEDDPVRALCLYEYLYRLRWRDLLVVADWRARRDALGLSVWDEEDPDAPPEVRAIYEHLDGNPREK